MFTVGQKATFEYFGTNYLLSINATVVEGQSESEVVKKGMLVSATSIVCETPGNSGIKITNQQTSNVKTNLFKEKDFNFTKLGIGEAFAGMERTPFFLVGHQ